ncbi:MAG: hypothetical protein LUQ59_02465 [Methanothrix sp.]|nr:hypothetical protein [Methanothrix sp.]
MADGDCGLNRAALARLENIYGFIKPRDKHVKPSRQDRQMNDRVPRGLVSYIMQL